MFTAQLLTLTCGVGVHLPLLEVTDGSLCQNLPGRRERTNNLYNASVLWDPAVRLWCGVPLWDPAVGPCCGILLWDPVLGSCCKVIL